jgi:O-methyltransferase
MSFSPTPSRPPTAVEASSKMPFMRRLWDFLPGPLRRVIIRLMGNSRVRLRLLHVLGIRREGEFFSLSRGLRAIDLAMERIGEQALTGDYYEFGLYRGYSFWHAQNEADRLGLTGMRFFGFDSFEGLPEVEGADREKGIFFSGDYACGRDQVYSRLEAEGFDWSRAALIEGFFDQSLTPEVKVDHAMGPAAVVLIDCDLYQSTVPVLAFLDDLLQDGSIVLFDDWYCFGDSGDRGEQRAFREFLADRPSWTAESWIDFPVYGKAFIMRRATPA